MKTPVIAIFDVAHHQKQLYLFDEHYQVVHHEVAVLPGTVDDEGYPCEDIHALTQWLRKTMKALVRDRRFELRAVNTTSYGAALVHVDGQGRPVLPLYHNFKPLPGEVVAEFYHRYGGIDDFKLSTATPAMGMLNSGLQLYWIKQTKPQVFRRVKHTLHLPQYLSFLISQQAYSEITSLGCHTGLWDFRTEMPHAWIFAEKINRVLPPLVSTTATVTARAGTAEFECGIGIHDNVAALLPYQQEMGADFLLLVTGGCNVALAPGVTEPLTLPDIARGCLQYLDPAGRPVRVTRLCLLEQHDQFTEKLRQHFGKPEGYERTLRYDPALVLQLGREQRPEKSYRVLPDEFTSQPTRLSDQWLYYQGFESFEEAYHRLNLDLVTLQHHAIRLTLAGRSVSQIVVAGPFARMPVFFEALGAALSPTPLMQAPEVEASALGSALVLNARWNSEQPRERLVNAVRRPLNRPSRTPVDFRPR